MTDFKRRNLSEDFYKLADSLSDGWAFMDLLAQELPEHLDCKISVEAELIKQARKTADSLGELIAILRGVAEELKPPASAEKKNIDVDRFWTMADAKGL